MTMKKSERIKFEEELVQFYNIIDKKFICKKCNTHIKSKYLPHANRCIGLGIEKSIKNNNYNENVHSKTCHYGCLQEAKFFYKNGKSYCCKMGNNCPIKTQKDSLKKKEHSVFANSEYKGFEKGIASWNKGLTKQTSEEVRKCAEAAKLAYKLHGNQRKTILHTQETKEKISQLMYARYASGWQATSCGRAKSYPYDNPSEGIVHLTGTWELALATALDKANIKWLRNKKRFDYIKPNGEAATYLPDFYLPTSHLFLECKGYETPLDVAKWTQFNEPLIILRKKEIFQIKKWLNQSLDITQDMILGLFVGNHNV
jgi:hypothetical protein